MEDSTMSLTAADRPEASRVATRTIPPEAPSGRYDECWIAAVSVADAVLRRIYGVYGFCDHQDCLLRVARAAARHRLTLSDGTEVHPGEPIAMLHFWNERIPRFPPGGPDLGWARLFRKRMLFSLRALAQFMNSHPEWDDVHAIRGCVNFGSRARRWQIQVAAARFGFELVPVESAYGLHECGEDLLIWAFARAFNPFSLRRHVMWRDRTEIWISKPSLLRRYG